MAGTIVVDRLESDASYASSINVASPLVVSNTISLGSAAAITGNVNIDNGTLFVDQNNNRVGVNTQNPGSALDISGGVFVRGSTNPGTITNRIVIDYNGFSGIATISANSNGGDTQLTFGTSKSGSNATRMTINQDGHVTRPYQPAFRARKTSTQIITNNAADIKVTYDTADTNIGSHYNTSTSRFTAPVTGWYHFNAFFMYNSFPTNWDYSFIRFLFNGSTSNSEIMYNRITSGQNFLTLHGSTYYYMSANDYVEVYARLVGGSSNAQIRDSFAEFQGMFIG